MSDFTYENIGFGLVRLSAVSEAAQQYLGVSPGDHDTIEVGYDEADMIALLIESHGFTLAPVAGDLSEIAA